MRHKLKTMNPHAAIPMLSMLGSLVLVGCASAGGQRREVPYWSLNAPGSQMNDTLAMTHSGNSDAVMFAPGTQTDPSFYAYERELTPEYARRDGDLAVSSPDATAGWYAWPEQARPSLDDQGRFYISNNPNVFVYPGGDDRRSSSVYGRRDRSFYGRDGARRGGDRSPRRHVR